MTRSIPTPGEIGSRRVAVNQEAIGRLIDYFVGKLEEEYNDRVSYCSVNVPDGTDDFVLQEVLARFRAKGWDVRATYDQRDNDSWIVFKKSITDLQEARIRRGYFGPG